MKRRYVVGICLIVWALCIVLSACTKTTYELPADTSAIEEYIETTSAAIEETNFDKEQHEKGYEIAKLFSDTVSDLNNIKIIPNDTIETDLPSKGLRCTIRINDCDVTEYDKLEKLLCEVCTEDYCRKILEEKAFLDSDNKIYYSAEDMRLDFYDYEESIITSCEADGDTIIYFCEAYGTDGGGNSKEVLKYTFSVVYDGEKYLISDCSYNGYCNYLLLCRTLVNSETAPEEPLSDFDKAIFLAEQIVSERKRAEFQLYDMDFDGTPELLEYMGIMDTSAWEIYKLTGDEAVYLGYIEYRDSEYDPVTGLTFGDGVHIYRDKETDEVFYVGEYSTEMHTEGHYECSKFRICADRLDETVISRCEFYTYDDCGNSGNRYIYYNDIAGQQASPRYRVDSNAEGFRFCNELEEYLSQYEYLGIIDGTNTFSAKSGENFFEYAEQFRNLPKLKDEQVYVDKTEYVTVCGTEYDINSYSAKIKITEENFDSIDFTELKKLPKLELLTVDNLTEKEIDIAPLNELENLRWLDISGEYDKEQLKEFDKLEFLNNGAPLEILAEMDSLKCIDAGGADNLSVLYNMEQLEAVKYCYLQQQNGEIDKLAEKRPDLLLIYVP